MEINPFHLLWGINRGELLMGLPFYQPPPQTPNVKREKERGRRKRKKERRRKKTPDAVSAEEKNVDQLLLYART